MRARARARHAKPSQLRNVTLTTGLATAVTVPLMASPANAHSVGSASSSSSNASSSTLLRQGSAGAAVADVQRRLGITADGIFGRRTRAAVIRFQSSRGLVADGIVGPRTRAALAGRSVEARSVRASAVSPVSQPVARESRLTHADGAGSETFNGLRPHAAWSARVIKNKFGVGTVYGKGARPNNPSSDHPRGLAADFVTSRSQGDRVRDFVIANWRQLNVKYIIWEGRISTDRGRTWRPSSGHFGHVHVSFLDTPVDFTY